MGWGLGLYDPVKIPVKTACKGYYLMWWYNGWHYWYFLSGNISVLTEGEKYITLGTRKLGMSSGQTDRDQMIAIKTILFTKEVYVLTDYGWKPLRIDPGSFIVYDFGIAGAEIEFIGNIGSSILSVTGYSPLTYIGDTEMKYLQVVNLTGAFVDNDITTTLISEPYNVDFIDSAGTIITNSLSDPIITLSGGVYHITVQSALARNNVKLKIIY